VEVTASPSEKLPKDVMSLGERFQDRFKAKMEIKERTVKNVIPYYTDLKTNQFSVLSKKDDPDSASDDPYNIGLAAFITATETGTVHRFSDDGIVEESHPILDKIATYIHKVHHNALEWEVEIGDTADAQIFRLANMRLANLYWFKETGKDNLIVPPSVMETYSKSQSTPKKGSYKTYKQLLKEELLKLNKGPNSDRMANAFVYLIESAFLYKHHTGSQKWALENIIKKHKKFTPSLAMLGVNGLLPDVKIRKYKDLFLPSEWEIISSETVIYKAEAELHEMMRKAITHNNLLAFLKKVEAIAADVKREDVSDLVRQLRRDRLRFAGELKESSKKKSTFRLGLEISNNLENRKIREAFNPFRIGFSAGRLKVTPSELMSYVVLDDGKSYYTFHYEVAGIDVESDRLITAVGLQFVEWLG